MMDEVHTFLANIPLIRSLPEWAKVASLNLLGFYVVLCLLSLILKKLQTPELRTAIAALSSLSGEALRRAGRSLHIPVERPRLTLACLWIDTFVYYMFSLIFFAEFGFFLMLSTTRRDLVFTGRLIGFGASGGFLLLTRWYFASAERTRIAAVEQWRTLREQRDADKIRAAACTTDTARRDGQSPDPE